MLLLNYLRERDLETSSHPSESMLLQFIVSACIKSLALPALSEHLNHLPLFSDYLQNPFSLNLKSNHSHRDLLLSLKAVMYDSYELLAQSQEYLHHDWDNIFTNLTLFCGLYAPQPQRYAQLKVFYALTCCILGERARLSDLPFERTQAAQYFSESKKLGNPREQRYAERSLAQPASA